MENRYEIWDLQTRNLVGVFTTEDEALELVRNAIEDWGQDAASSLAMGIGEIDDVAHHVVDGDALIQRALAAVPE